MLSKRLTIGSLLIALLIAAAWVDATIDTTPAPDALRPVVPGPSWPPGVIVLVVIASLAALGSRELARLLRGKGVDASWALTGSMAVLGVLMTGIVPDRGSAFIGAATINTTTALVVVAAMIYYSRGGKTDGALAAVGGALLGFAYIGLLLGFWVALRRDHSVWILLWVILITKVTDIGAYFVGSLFGKHKLIGWLSPGKTWEGLVGGVACAIAVGAAGAWALRAADIGPLDPLWGALLALPLAVLGQMGDLSASLLKRDAGVKDTGGSVPGFGGVIDVIDSLLFVGPAAFWMLKPFA